MVRYVAILGGQYCQVLDNTNTHKLLCRYIILYRIPLYINREGGFRDLVELTGKVDQDHKHVVDDGGERVRRDNRNNNNPLSYQFSWR